MHENLSTFGEHVDTVTTVKRSGDVAVAVKSPVDGSTTHIYVWSSRINVQEMVTSVRAAVIVGDESNLLPDAQQRLDRIEEELKHVQRFFYVTTKLLVACINAEVEDESWWGAHVDGFDGDFHSSGVGDPPSPLLEIIDC